MPFIVFTDLLFFLCILYALCCCTPSRHLQYNLNISTCEFFGSMFNCRARKLQWWSNGFPPFMRWCVDSLRCCRRSSDWYRTGFTTGGHREYTSVLGCVKGERPTPRTFVRQFLLYLLYILTMFRSILNVVSHCAQTYVWSKYEKTWQWMDWGFVGPTFLWMNAQVCALFCLLCCCRHVCLSMPPKLVPKLLVRSTLA